MHAFYFRGSNEIHFRRWDWFGASLGIFGIFYAISAGASENFCRSSFGSARILLSNPAITDRHRLRRTVWTRVGPKHSKIQLFAGSARGLHFCCLGGGGGGFLGGWGHKFFFFFFFFCFFFF